MVEENKIVMDYLNCFKESLIHLAVLSGSLKLVEYVVRNKVDINAANID